MNKPFYLRYPKLAGVFQLTAGCLLFALVVVIVSGLIYAIPHPTGTVYFERIYECYHD